MFASYFFKVFNLDFFLNHSFGLNAFFSKGSFSKLPLLIFKSANNLEKNDSFFTMLNELLL